jgi:hypothetical protein
MADFWTFVRKAKELYSWYSFAAGGLALAIAGGIWLVAHGVPWPLAAMAAYCTIVAAMYVVALPTVLSRANNSTSPISSPISKPNYSIWKHRAELYLYEVAYLLADEEPNRAPERMVGDAAAWFNLLAEEIKRNELQRIQTDFDDKHHIFLEIGYRPHFDTRIDASELKTFCKKRGLSPPFLR